MLTDKIRHTIARYHMIPPGGRVLAAVSGGPDSVAMLHALAEFAPEYGYTLAVAHLDHGFRPESAEEAAFVGDMARGMGLVFVTERSDIKQRLELSPENKQAAAREARYSFLARAAQETGSDAIAVGHTADDQAETYIMRELRGSGMHGLSAIPPVRGNIIRPLIEATRADVMEYLSQKGLQYRTDPSNLRPDYLRNRIRLELMPRLLEYNPKLVEALCNSAEIHRDEDEFLDAYTSDMLNTIVAEKSACLVALDIAKLEDLPVAILRRAIRQVVAQVKGDLLSVGFGHIMEAVELATMGGTGRGVDMPGGVRVERSYDRLLVYGPDAAPKEFSVTLPVPGRVEVPEAGVSVEVSLTKGGPGPVTGKGAALVDMDKITGPLTVRSRRPGDTFQPVGMEGSKKLKELFIDLKLPRFERARTPIVECGGEIVWVAGIRADRRFAADEATKDALLIKCEKLA